MDIYWYFFLMMKGNTMSKNTKDPKIAPSAYAKTWQLVFPYSNSIANFRVARYRKIGNIVVLGENHCNIRIQRPKITIWTNFSQYNYPISLIFEIYRSANYRISAFFNKSWVTNLATLQKPWVSRKNWFYFWILHKKVNQNQRF